MPTFRRGGRIAMSNSGLNRRQFLNRSLVAAAGAGSPSAGRKSSGRVIGANDTIRIGVAGLNGRGGARRRVRQDEGGRDHVPDRPRHPDLRQADQADREARRAAPQDRPGHPPGARRQEPRRDLDRHAQPLARADDHLGLPGGQGRLRREAVQPQRPRGPDRRRGRAEVRPDRPARHPEPRRSRSGPGLADVVKSGKLRQAPRLARPLLQAARAEHRLQAGHRRRPPSSTSTSGSARRPSSRSTPTSSTTTGTGSGTSATATSATRASTRWTSPAG